VHKKEEVKSGLSEMHNEEHRYMNSSQNIIRVIISRRMSWWYKYVESMEKKRNA
jgi:hypothetical protein